MKAKSYKYKPYKYLVYHFTSNYWWLGESFASFKELREVDHQNLLPIIFYKLFLMEGVRVETY